MNERKPLINTLFRQVGAFNPNLRTFVDLLPIDNYKWYYIDWDENSIILIQGELLLTMHIVEKLMIHLLDT